MTNLSNVSTNVSYSNLTEVINMNNVNKSALVSTIAAELFHNGLNERIALITAVAFVGAIDYVEDYEDFMEALIDGLEITTLEVVGAEDYDSEVDGDKITEALVAGNYLTVDGLGTRLEELVSLRTEAYAPALATEGVVRRFGYSKVKHSALAVRAVHALEDTPFTRCDFIYHLALEVQGRLGEDNDLEFYVMKGCAKMDTKIAYISEFKLDDRGRGYQAACHGPNGQSSDRSRALMDLYGVPQDYNIEEVKQHIKAEIMDMVKVPKEEVITYMRLVRKDPVAFLIDQLEKAKTDSEEVSKPWSFVKATDIWWALAKGNRPYIGMAVGLDAKCSGPQLGALMVGDQQIAAACGLTLEELEDAYMLALHNLKKAGFHNITRAGIKKAYMGVFYGQGWAAFTVVNGKEAIGAELQASMYGEGPVNDDVAKAFHKALTTSFGAKMVGVRQLFRGYGDKSKGRTKHFMPDGFEVAMNYKVKTNALGEVMEFDTQKYDVLLQNNAESYKFINFQMRSLETHEGDFARNGFVNMIQAADALVARLIITNLKQLGAKHIISVHDCFRVNVTEMHLLEKAIKMAYQELFGSEYNNATENLPYGTDILGMYFDGANKQLIDEADSKMVSQFFESGKRRMRKVNGVKVSELIDALGTSYYFAK